MLAIFALLPIPTIISLPLELKIKLTTSTKLSSILSLILLIASNSNSIVSFAIFLISIEDKNINSTYNTLLKELELYDKKMLQKKRLVVISKGDLNIDRKFRNSILKKIPTNIKCLFISSVSGDGLIELKDELWNILN